MVDEIHLESRRNAASDAVALRVSETATLSRAQTAEGNLSARASLLETTWHADSERSTAEGNLAAISESTNKEGSCRKSERKDRHRTSSTV